VNAPLSSFSRAERLALQQMLQDPDLVECHGSDLAWQEALSGVLARPSLRDSLNLAPPASRDVDVPTPR